MRYDAGIALYLRFGMTISGSGSGEANHEMSVDQQDGDNRIAGESIGRILNDRGHQTPGSTAIDPNEDVVSFCDRICHVGQV